MADTKRVVKGKEYYPDCSPYKYSEYDSKFEESIAEYLKTKGVEGRHNRDKIHFVQPAKNRFYTPDFKLPDGSYIEAKGLWTQANRLMHLMIKDQYPDIKIRFVFQYKNRKISKASKTTYEQYCEQHGFEYAIGEIPDEWFE